MPGLGEGIGHWGVAHSCVCTALEHCATLSSSHLDPMVMDSMEGVSGRMISSLGCGGDGVC